MRGQVVVKEKSPLAPPAGMDLTGVVGVPPSPPPL